MTDEFDVSTFSFRSPRPSTRHGLLVEFEDEARTQALCGSLS